MFQSCASAYFVLDNSVLLIRLHVKLVIYCIVYMLCVFIPLQTTKPKGPTLPQPFRLTAERKRKLSEGDVSCSKFESIAEKVIKFSSRTPERFRRRPSPATGL